MFVQNVVKIEIYKRATLAERLSNIEVRVGVVDHSGTGHERFRWPLYQCAVLEICHVTLIHFYISLH